MVVSSNDNVVPINTDLNMKEINRSSPQIKPSDKTEDTASRTVREILISALVMLLVAFSWALSTQFSKTALVLNKETFFAPYFLVWFNTNFMITCYPIYLLFGLIISFSKPRQQRLSIIEIHQNALLVYGASEHRISTYIRHTALFLSLWLGANYCYSRSLGAISASATASLMSTNTAMVCVLGWFILHDPFIPFRIISIAAAIGGVVVISMDKEFAGSTLGISLSIGSALFAAIYKVLFKRVNRNANLGQVAIFMSGLGLMNFVLNTIVAGSLIGFNAEIFTISDIPWLPLAGSALLNLSFNFLINFGIALLHPLVISVGMLFGIPISTVIDIIFRHMRVTPKFVIGAILILLSCAVIAVPAKLLGFCRFDRIRNSTAEEQTTNHSGNNEQQ